MSVAEQIEALERLVRKQLDALESLRVLAAGCLPSLAGNAALGVEREIEALRIAIARLKP